MAVYLTIFLIVAIIVGLIALLRYQRTPSRARNSARRESINGTGGNGGSLASLQQNQFFWGAELFQPGCTESYKMLGKQFSFTDAPKLPLDSCNRDICTCQFKGLRDRRVRARRTNPDRRSEIRFDQSHPDRRTLISRRRSDMWAQRTSN